MEQPTKEPWSSESLRAHCFQRFFSSSTQPFYFKTGKATLGYIDYVAISGIGRTATQAVSSIQEKVDSPIQLAEEYKINFDLAKSEFLVISVGPRKKLKTSGLTV